jgi:hypothetical protein
MFRHFQLTSHLLVPQNFAIGQYCKDQTEQNRPLVGVCDRWEARTNKLFWEESTLHCCDGCTKVKKVTDKLVEMQRLRWFTFTSARPNRAPREKFGAAFAIIFARNFCKSRQASEEFRQDYEAWILNWKQSKLNEEGAPPRSHLVDDGRSTY